MTKPFTITRRVQFVETDMAGVLHFSNYYRWMEETEHAFWRSHDLSVFIDDGAISWPRVKTTCEYHAPAHFEDEVLLTLHVANVTRRSVTYEVDFHRDGRRLAKGSTTAVCCAMKDGHFSSTPIPDNLRVILLAAVAETA